MVTNLRARFTKVIHERRLVRIRFREKKSGAVKERLCAPFDIGLLKRSPGSGEKYFMRDIDSPNGSHPLPLAGHQILDMTELDRFFDPSDHIDWDFKRGEWTIKRDWGRYS